ERTASENATAIVVVDASLGKQAGEPFPRRKHVRARGDEHARDQPVARKVRRAVQAARGVFVIDVAGVLRCCAEQLVNPRFALATRILTAMEELLAASDFIAQEVIAADAGPPRDVGGDGAIG